ncbi:MAG: glutathione S-transferase [Pseudomonadota bacterium]
MKLYDGGKAPNPRRVRIFLAEKGIEVPLEPVDMTALGHRSETVTTLNPMQRLPVLELDDGTAISESMAICRYFEELHPQPPLMGRNAKEKAVVDMWQRRLEFHLLLEVANVFRHTHPAMAQWEVPQLPDFAAARRPRVEAMFPMLDTEFEQKEFIAGDVFTVADITAMIALDFCKPARITIPQEHGNLHRWYGQVKARPSANA